MTVALRIAQVCPYGLDRYGGVRSHILGLGEALQARGHDVQVIAPGNDGHLGTLSVIGCGTPRAMQFGGTHFDVAWASAAALARAGERRFDVLHLHTPWNPALPLQIATRLHGARVGTFHDVAGVATPRWARALMPVASALIRRMVLHATIAVSPAVSRYLGPGTHELIPNGVDTPHLTPSGEAAQSPGSPASAPVVFLGRLEPRKDVTTLFHAMARLGDQAPPLRILGDGPLRGALQSLRDELGLRYVEFRGAVGEAEKWDSLRGALCLVAPSQAGESFGIVLLEAMAAGALPIAADNPGYRHVLGEGGASLLFPPGDAEALATRIHRAATDAPWQHAMREWASGRWPAFAWSAIAKRVEHTYQRAMVQASR